MDDAHSEGYPLMDTRGERREKKRKKKNKMIVSGRSILTLLRVINKKAQEHQDLLDDSREVPGG